MPVGRAVLTGKYKFNSGRRDVLVTVEGATTPPGGGFPMESWTPIEDIWMARTELNADERFAAGQDSAYGMTQWQAPYTATLDPDLVNVAGQRRLRYGVRVFNIRTASVLGRREGIELLTLAQSVPSV